MAEVMRIVVGVIGALMVIGGLVAIAAGQPAAGVWTIVLGGVGIAAVALERSRYRSEASERSAGDHGPGGGEPSKPAAPFRPTDELFIDPTSGQRLRVYINPATGDRRYYADEAPPGT
jgi:hypothetical protein